MRTILIATMLFISIAKVNAQHDYKALLDKLYQYSETAFAAISGPEDKESFFIPCTIAPGIGMIRINKTSFGTTLNWEIPLAQSIQVQKQTIAFIRSRYNDTTKYQTGSDGTEEEGQIWTTVYVINGDAKPIPVFKTIYYRDTEEPEKSSFSIIFYGK